MTELFLILDDEPLTRRNITLVDTEKQAKAIVGNNPYMSYEKVETLSDDDVKDWVCDERLSTMDNASLFYDKYCRDCVVNYDEKCPYME